MASRPSTVRTASTNLGGNSSSKRVLEGKLAIVTGASRGIGAATAINLASKGASVVLNYTSDSSTQPTQDLAARLEAEHGVTAIAVQADLGHPSGPSHLVTTVKNRLSHPKTGRFQVDILVNNAGIASNNPVTDVDVDVFHKLYSVNVLGPLLMIQAVEPYLPTDRSGRIVNVSSVSASQGFVGQSVYGGTKAALEAMTRTWARELAERATVNAIAPGPVATDMWGGVNDAFMETLSSWVKHTPLAGIREGVDDEKTVKDSQILKGRPAYGWEIAGVIAMLCTPDGGYCTGSTVCANGGMVLHN